MKDNGHESFQDYTSLPCGNNYVRHGQFKLAASGDVEA